MRAEEISPPRFRDLCLSDTIGLFPLAQLEELSYSGNNAQQETACVTDLCQRRKKNKHQKMKLDANLEREGLHSLSLLKIIIISSVRLVRRHENQTKKRRLLTIDSHQRHFHNASRSWGNFRAVLLIFFLPPLCSVREMAPRKWGLAQRFMSCHS